MVMLNQGNEDNEMTEAERETCVNIVMSIVDAFVHNTEEMRGAAFISAGVQAAINVAYVCEETDIKENVRYYSETRAMMLALLSARMTALVETDDRERAKAMLTLVNTAMSMLGATFNPREIICMFLMLTVQESTRSLGVDSKISNAQKSVIIGKAAQFIRDQIDETLGR